MAAALGHGDLTTPPLLPPNLQRQGIILVKSRGVVAGIDVAAAVFQRLDYSIRVDILSTDGIWLEAGTPICRLEGNLP
ncbi:MAG: nicotinate-nucleotide diphosphorylase (carboxylating), partial [Chloroflexi bacterium]|nr:nicotinate-nucleotide diphosphorylase (carboxylating) [Chloroflexota bacterium]